MKTAKQLNSFHLPAGVAFLDLTESQQQAVAALHSHVEDMSVRVVAPLGEVAQRLLHALPQIEGHETAIREFVSDSVQSVREEYAESEDEAVEILLHYSAAGLLENTEFHSAATGGYSVVMPASAYGLHSSGASSSNMLSTAKDVLGDTEHLLMRVKRVAVAETFEQEEEKYKNQEVALTTDQARMQERALVTAMATLQAASMQSMDAQLGLMGVLKSLATVIAQLNTYSASTANLQDSKQLRSGMSDIVTKLETQAIKDPAAAALVRKAASQLRNDRRTIEGVVAKSENKITMRATPVRIAPVIKNTGDKVVSIRSAFQAAAKTASLPVPREGATILNFTARAPQAVSQKIAPVATEVKVEKSVAPQVAQKISTVAPAEVKIEKSATAPVVLKAATAAPTTVAPAAALATVAPTAVAPAATLTAVAPVSIAPVAAAPVAAAPVTVAPTTSAPASVAPTVAVAAPVQAVPVQTSAPIAQAPVAQTPVAQAPTMQSATPVAAAPTIVQAAPVQTAPVQTSAPIAQAPAVQIVTIQTAAPVAATPVQVAPIQIAPAAPEVALKEVAPAPSNPISITTPSPISEAIGPREISVTPAPTTPTTDFQPSPITPIVIGGGATVVEPKNDPAPANPAKDFVLAASECGDCTGERGCCRPGTTLSFDEKDVAAFQAKWAERAAMKPAPSA